MQKNIILDFDGTLIDTERVMMRSVMEYAEMNSVPNDEEFMLKFVGVSPQYIAGRRLVYGSCDLDLSQNRGF